MFQNSVMKVVGCIVLGLAVLLVKLDYSTVNAFPRQTNSNRNPSSHARLTIDQLTEAVLANDVQMVNQIIKDETFDLNRKDSKGTYPIEAVLVMDNCQMAKILLRAGANPYVISAQGVSVYEIVQKGDNKMLKAIFEQYRNTHRKR